MLYNNCGDTIPPPSGTCGGGFPPKPQSNLVKNVPSLLSLAPKIKQFAKLKKSKTNLFRACYFWLLYRWIPPPRVFCLVNISSKTSNTPVQRSTCQNTTVFRPSAPIYDLFGENKTFV